MKAAAIIALCAGCYGVDNIDGTWEPAEVITGALAPELGPDPPPRPPPEGGVLRVVTWNVQVGSDPLSRARELLASPALARADVVLLQEIEQYPDQISQAQVIAEALEMTWIYAPARAETPGYRQGIAILSRYPLRDGQVMVLPLGQAYSFWETVRIALRAELELGALRVAVETVHLDVVMGPVDRVRQLHPAVTREIPDDVMVGGDFNTNPWVWVAGTVPLTNTEAIAGQDQATVLDDYMDALGFVSPIPSGSSTFDRALLDMRLDTIYVRGYPVLVADIAKDVDGSDHYPVWIDVRLPIPIP